jgi:hypothetical protein
MTAVDDLRILHEMAEEIATYRFVSLPRSGSILKTKRGQYVGRILEDVARNALDARYEKQRLKATIDGLRDEMQRMTDQMLEMENKHVG